MSQNIVDKDIDNLYDEIEKIKANINDLSNKNYYYYDWPWFELSAGETASKSVAFNSSGKPFIVLFKVNHNCKSEHSWTKIEIKRESTIVSVSQFAKAIVLQIMKIVLQFIWILLK